MSSLEQTLLWLCSIPSVTGEETALCEAVLARLSRHGLAFRRRKNSFVVGPSTLDPAKQHVVFAGHLDTVRASHDGPARIEQGRVYGAGASDMKAGLALMIAAIAESWTWPHVQLSHVFYAGEEGPLVHNELTELLRHDAVLAAGQVDLAVCLEPSDNCLQLGCMGTVHARVEVRGRSAHSARPWQGDNAIYKALPLLQAVADRQPRDVTVDGLVYTAVLSATMIQAGVGRNVIPGECTFNLNHRFPPSSTVDQAVAEIRQLVGAAGDLEIVDAAPSALPFRSHPFVQSLEEVSGCSAQPKQAWTDVAQFAAAGIPAVNFGPGQPAQAHQPNEWASIESLHRGSQILRDWLGQMGSRHPGA